MKTHRAPAWRTGPPPGPRWAHRAVLPSTYTATGASLRYTVILIPDEDGGSSVSVPAMPGCFSQGDRRADALANAREAMELWVEAEAEEGRAPLGNTPQVVAQGVAEALQILEELRSSGDIPDRGDALELVPVELRRAAAA
jgi:predicted RNase H-like HicB family nuclease